MSIASEITRLQNDSAAIAAAIAAKGVTVPSGSGYDDYASLIGQISGGGGSDPDAWLKDGDTHLWIDIKNDYQKAQKVRIRMIGTINWGDGTTDTVSVTTYTTFTHTYSDTGKYRIDLHPTSGTFYLGGASNTYNVMGERAPANVFRTSVLYQVEVGTARITTLSNYAFYYCLGLKRVYIPKTIVTLGTYVFYYCYALSQVVFEDSTKITSTSLNSTFYYCYALQDIGAFAPPSVTSMSATYRGCYALCEITIPSTVTSVAAHTFAALYGLKKLKCLPQTPPTVAADTAFTDLPSNCVIEVPAGKLSAYQAAGYWSTYASQMVEASS